MNVIFSFILAIYWLNKLSFMLQLQAETGPLLSLVVLFVFLGNWRGALMKGIDILNFYWFKFITEYLVVY